MALAGVWAIAVLGCLIGLAIRPSANLDPGVGAQLFGLVRVLTTTVLAIVLVLGPGIALRAATRHRLQLGFLPLPGLALLAATGGVAWAVGLLGWAHPRIVCAAIQLTVLACLPIAVARGDGAEVLSDEEWRILVLVAAPLGIAIARSLWSLGPAGELYGGTIYRTLEVGDRPDSRISFHVVQLVANANTPYGPVAHSYFSPYSFSDRGPLAGFASTPIVMLSGGRPPVVVGAETWLPFDPQGFMAYRLAMMTFAATAFMSLWTLTARIAGDTAARLAVLLAATTPFLVHEIWFTWPKMLAASLVLLAAVSVLERRPLVAGVLVGVGYMVHPLALLSVPALLLLALWPHAARHLHRPRLMPAIMLAFGLGVFVITWRLANGSHYTQSAFQDYLKQAGSTRTLAGDPVTLSAWISDRLVSIGNTLVPLRLFLLSAHDQEINSALQTCFPFCTGGSPWVVHFFFQYWTTLPFGLGIVFFPFLLSNLWRAFRRWPWAILATVVVPFVAFAVYWGAASTGLLREGLHAWVLTLFVVIGAQQRACGFPWLRSSLVRAVLATRPLGVLLVAVLPTVVTSRRVVAGHFVLTDSLAVIAMLALATYLGAAVWREKASSPAEPTAGGAYAFQ